MSVNYTDRERNIIETIKYIIRSQYPKDTYLATDYQKGKVDGQKECVDKILSLIGDKYH